ncbi:MAG: hypothetical protein ACE5KM_16745 [Planctomycetaceae bacterium]
MIRMLVRGIRRVFTKGPIDTARWAWYHVYEGSRERWLGIETIGSGAWADAFENQDCHEYQPLYYAGLDRAFKRLRIRRGKDVFLDYGSGMGRIVTVAATHPFKKVIGVEMLPDLNEISRTNIERARRRLKCPDVEIIQTDATTYELPPDVTVIFLFNPFFGDVLRAVQQQIRKSLEAHPRNLQLVYMNPLVDPDLFEECDWLTRRADLPVGLWTAMRFRLYENRQSDMQPTGNAGVLAESHA